MPRDHDRQMFVRPILHLNHFVDRLRFHPFLVHRIFVGIRRVERLEIKVLHVGAVIRESPCNVIVVPDDNERCTGQGEPFHIPSRRSEMNFVPDRWNRKLEVRVVGQQRLTGCRVIAGYDPIVAAQAVANFVLRIPNVADDGIRQRRRQVGRRLRLRRAVRRDRSIRFRLEHAIRFHVVIVVVIIISVGIETRPLRTIIRDVGIADDIVVHRRIGRKKLARSICADSLCNFRAIDFLFPGVGQRFVHIARDNQRVRRSPRRRLVF